MSFYTKPVRLTAFIHFGCDKIILGCCSPLYYLVKSKSSKVGNLLHYDGQPSNQDDSVQNTDRRRVSYLFVCGCHTSKLFQSLHDDMLQSVSFRSAILVNYLLKILSAFQLSYGLLHIFFVFCIATIIVATYDNLTSSITITTNLQLL